MRLVSNQDKQLRPRKRMVREATSGSTLIICSIVRSSKSVKGWPPGTSPRCRCHGLMGFWVQISRRENVPLGEPRLQNASDCFASKRANINALQHGQACVQAVTAPAPTAYDAIRSLMTGRYTDFVDAMCRQDPEGDRRDNAMNVRRWVLAGV